MHKEIMFVFLQLALMQSAFVIEVDVFSFQLIG